MGNHDSNVGPGRHAMSGKFHLSTDSDDDDPASSDNDAGSGSDRGGLHGTTIESNK
jgi:hypothetical protein